MCLGGHLAFRAAFDKRIKAAVCYFATDIHSHTLGHGKNDDSLDRVKDMLTLAGGERFSPASSSWCVALIFTSLGRFRKH